MSVTKRTGAAAQVADALATRTGLDFTGSHQARMYSTLERELRETRSRTAGEYMAHLERDPDAFGRLIGRLTVGETYFFRDLAQIEMLRAVIASWTDQPGSRRVWSAGCATGEEPYTLAILLDEAGQLDRTHIVGTDLSESAIEKARRAAYGKWSLRRTGIELRERYFVERHGLYELRKRFVEAVEYRVEGLLQGPPAVGVYDLVLCRNVLLYLHDDALHQAARTLRDSLRPQGQLVVGASDPALPIDGLELLRTEHGLLYRRTEARSGAAPDRPAPLQGTRTEPVRRPAPRRPRPRSRTAPGRRPIQAVAEPAQPGLLTSEQLSDAVATLTAAGRCAEAERLVASAVDERPLDTDARILEATLHIRAGRLPEAAAAAKAAAYLDPDLVIAHLLLGRVELQRDATASARRSLRTAVELLSEMSPDEEVPGSGGERADGVTAAVSELLHASEKGST